MFLCKGNVVYDPDLSMLAEVLELIDRQVATVRDGYEDSELADQFGVFDRAEHNRPTKRGKERLGEGGRTPVAGTVSWRGISVWGTPQSVQGPTAWHRNQGLRTAGPR